MAGTDLSDTSHVRRREALLEPLLARLEPLYPPEERAALRVEAADPACLAQRSGRGFVDRDTLETVLGNMLELVAPGSHHAGARDDGAEPLRRALGAVADQIQAMVAQSLAAAGAARDADQLAWRGNDQQLYGR